MLAAPRIARGRSNHDAALDEASELVDLLGVITTVRHGHDDDVGYRSVEAGPDRSCRAWTVGVDDETHTVVLLGVLLDPRDGRIFRGVTHDQDLAPHLDRLGNASQCAHDRLVLIFCGDYNGNSRFHTLTPPRRTPQTSTTGLTISSWKYLLWGAPMMTRSECSSSCSSGTRSASTLT